MSTSDLPLKFLASAKIGEKGQLTVPKQFREDLGLGTGAPFAVLRLGDGLILVPEQQRFERLCQKISSALVAAGASAGALLESLPEARRRVVHRRYGTGTTRRSRGRRGK